MNRQTRIYLFATLLSVFMLMLLGSSAGAKETRETIGSWQVSCDGDKCRIGQSLANPQKPGIIYSAEISKPAADKNPVMTLSFPLGLYLPPGIGVRVGKTKKEVPMSVCLPRGCKALVTIDDPLKKALLQSPSFYVRFYTTEKTPREITFPLRGFLESFAKTMK